MTELVGIVCHSRFLQSIQKCHSPAAIRIDYYESQLWLIYFIADGHSLWFHWEKQFVTKNSNAAFTVFYFQRHWEDKWPYGTECGFVKPFTESLFLMCWKWRNGGCWFLVLKFLCINKFQLVQLDTILVLCLTLICHAWVYSLRNSCNSLWKEKCITPVIIIWYNNIWSF